jgi:hypothetical protein
MASARPSSTVKRKAAKDATTVPSASKEPAKKKGKTKGIDRPSFAGCTAHTHCRNCVEARRIAPLWEPALLKGTELPGHCCQQPTGCICYEEGFCHAVSDEGDLDADSTPAQRRFQVYSFSCVSVAIDRACVMAGCVMWVHTVLGHCANCRGDWVPVVKRTPQHVTALYRILPKYWSHCLAELGSCANRIA